MKSKIFTEFVYGFGTMLGYITLTLFALTCTIVLASLNEWSSLMMFIIFGNYLYVAMTKYIAFKALFIDMDRRCMTVLEAYNSVFVSKEPVNTPDVFKTQKQINREQRDKSMITQSDDDDEIHF